LCGLRAALYDYLKVAGEAEVRVVGVARDVGVDEGAADYACDVVDQRMLDDAVGDVDYVVSVFLEEADLRGVEATSDGEAGAVAEGAQLAGDRCDLWQAVGFGQFVESVARGRRDGALAEARAAGARRAMGAGVRRSEIPEALGRATACLPR
jgi:hypothetical protein